MRVKEVMTSPVTTIASHDSIGHAARLLHEGGFRHLPVVRDGRLIGMLSDRDIVEARARGAIRALLTVESFMRHDVVTATPITTIEEASRLLLEHKIRALPVVDVGSVVGIVTTSDLCRMVADGTGRFEPRPVAPARASEHPEVWLG